MAKVVDVLDKGSGAVIIMDGMLYRILCVIINQDSSGLYGCLKQIFTMFQLYRRYQFYYLLSLRQFQGSKNFPFASVANETHNTLATPPLKLQNVKW